LAQYFAVPTTTPLTIVFPEAAAARTTKNMPRPSKPTATSQLALQPSMAWLTVFLPALSYYIATRMNMSSFLSHSSFGTVSTDSLPLASFLSRETSAGCSELQDIFYIRESCTAAASSPSKKKSLQLRHPLYLVLGETTSKDDNDAANDTANNKVHIGSDSSSGLQDVVDSTWRHDVEIGRGYLLLSQSYQNGRIWRFETGGGPIAIGKTLHMEPSGCRSNNYKSCSSSNGSKGNSNNNNRVGSAGLAIDFHTTTEEHSSEGLLVVTELGEGRIVRMEKSGARTPLIVQVPSFCSVATPATTDGATTPISSKNNHLMNPTKLLYTPFGDLLIGETSTDCHDNTVIGGILRLKNAMSIKELSSSQSRQAHSWNTTLNHDEEPEILYQNNGIGYVIGLALDPSWTGVYLTSIHPKDHTLSLHHLKLDMDDDDDEDSTEDQKKDSNSVDPANETNTVGGIDNESSKPRGLLDDSATLVYTVKSRSSSSSINTAAATTDGGGAIAVDQKGHIYVATYNGILVLDGPNGNLLTTLEIPKPPTSLTLGEDGFLYVTTRNQLFRIRVKNGPVIVPTNLIGKRASYVDTLHH